jgi:nucleoside-diphosphate-sugar epimerase
MKIVVTGGAGYLGTVLSQRLLDAGHEVRAVDNLLHGGLPVLALAGREGFEFIRGDVRDERLMARALKGAGAVVHLAAIVGDPACARSAEETCEVNVGASTALVVLAVAGGVERFVFASTCSNYGTTRHDPEPVTEGSELRPLSLYAESKVAVERHLARIPASCAAITVLRFATLFGLSPRMRFDLTVNGFARDLVLEGRIAVRGPGAFRPYVHVRDAARAVALVLSAPAPLVSGRVFNVGASTENHRKLDLARLIRDAVGGGEIDVLDEGPDTRDYRVSFERLRRELGYEITRDVRAGAREVAAAVRAGAVDDVGFRRFFNVAP